MWRWTAALRERAEAEDWEAERYTAAVVAGLDTMNPLQHLELHFDGGELRVRFPHRGARLPHAKLQQLLDDAAAFDLAASLEFVERRLTESPQWAGWAVQFFIDHHPPGTALPPLFVEAVPVTGKLEEIEPLWRAMSAESRQRKVELFLHGSIAYGCVAWSVVKDLTELRAYWEMTPPIATGLLAVGSRALKFSSSEGASKIVAECKDPKVAAVLEAWRKMGGPKGGKATAQWSKRALKMLDPP